MHDAGFNSPDEGAPGVEEAAVLPATPEAAPGLDPAPWTGLLKIPGVQGAGLGRDSLGNDEIVAYVLDDATRRSLPDAVGGLRVRGEITGQIDAQSTDAQTDSIHL